jgi:hypothetical protein
MEMTLLSGKMDQESRSRVFSEFSDQKSGALFCTNVAARGLGIIHLLFSFLFFLHFSILFKTDIPQVDLVIQVGIPENLVSKRETSS